MTISPRPTVTGALASVTGAQATGNTFAPSAAESVTAVTAVTGGSEADSTHAVAAFIRTRGSIDRGALLKAILARWPDLSGQELQAAIDIAGQRQDGGKLARALEWGAQ